MLTTHPLLCAEVYKKSRAIPLLSLRAFAAYERVKKQSVELLVTQSSPLSCYLVPLRTRYLPQHPILNYPSPVFLPHCARPRFTPTRNHVLSRFKPHYLVSANSIVLLYFLFWCRCGWCLQHSGFLLCFFRIVSSAVSQCWCLLVCYLPPGVHKFLQNVGLASKFSALEVSL